MEKHRFKEYKLTAIKLRTNNRCYYCGNILDDDYEIIDISDDIFTDYDHVAICSGCNHLKGDKSKEEFRNYLIDVMNNLENDKVYSILFNIGYLKKSENYIRFYGEKLNEYDTEEELIQGIKKQISRYFELKNGELEKDTRAQKIVWPRQLAHYFAVHKTNLSLENIGFYIGNKDHTTVIHGVKTVLQEIETNKRKKEQFNFLSKIFNL